MTRSISIRDTLIHTSHFSVSSERAKFYREARRGEFVRLANGVYLPTERWDDLGPDDRYLTRLAAISLMGGDEMVFARESAAAVWQLPVIGDWPTRAHVVRRAGTTESRRYWTSHEVRGSIRKQRVRGFTVTDLAQTVADVARSSPYARAVAMTDRALGGVTIDGNRWRTRQEVVLDRIESDRLRGTSRALEIVRFADGRSGSAGESLSRCTMRSLGAPPPVLQHEFRDENGQMIVDFWWPEFNLVGEFDGRGKYLRDARGRSAADVVVSEKWREDRIRAQGPRFTRWGWDVARSSSLLSSKLRAAGLEW